MDIIRLERRSVMFKSYWIKLHSNIQTCKLIIFQPSHTNSLKNVYRLNINYLIDNQFLFTGVRKLSAILATGARSGTWRIEARCGGGSARVDITVGNGIGNTAAAAPAAEQHYVELRFADSMRRRYKPGLPFVGRVSFEKKGSF